ncbi:MAG: ATP-binding cassette domain-containing protein [Lachnospiraceae bacterium]|nr:ATP-binding cassette domain-containing protein [Lachnospiraceae bacterium]
MDYILETQGLTKTYGKKHALENVSLHVAEGDIYGFVGRNGAGKTTLMKIVGGLSNASSGSYKLFGCEPARLGNKTLERGLLIEDPGYYPDCSGFENLYIKCLAFGIRDKNEPKRLLEMVGLQNVGKLHVKKYSFGMKQRLGIALAFVGNPGFMILDEPINGFDPEGISSMRDLIRKKNSEGTTFLISSHILDELAKIATKFGFIDNGRLIEENDAVTLKEKCKSKIELITDNPSAATTVLEQIGFSDYRVFDNGRTEIYEQLDRTGDITNALAARGIATLEIVKKYETLENYYIGLVGNGSAAGSDTVKINDDPDTVRSRNDGSKSGIAQTGRSVPGKEEQ